MKFDRPILKDKKITPPFIFKPNDLTMIETSSFKFYDE